MPMLGQSEAELERDRNKLRNFISKNPYPKYGEVITIIKGNQDMYMNMYAEYGQENHTLIKEIYENVLDKELVKRNGELIRERGDETAMVWNYYSLLTVVAHFLKKGNMNDEDNIFIHYNFKNLVSCYWNGVGEWKH